MTGNLDRARIFAAATVLAVACTCLQAAGAGERLVAVGDVHGAYDEFVAILQRAQLIDEEMNWIGGSSTFIQTGDLFDRGLGVFETIDLLMRLQDQAEEAGGRVTVLLGNHEGMNLIGFYRDVNPQLYERFVDDRSEKRRKQGFKGFKKYLAARAKVAGLGPPHISDEVKEQWMALYPPGRIEYEEAIGPDGVYGRWLRTLPVAVLEDDTLFIHAGLSEAVAGMSIADINAEMKAELAAYDTTRQYMLDEGLIPPHVGLADMMVVYRGLQEPDPELAPLADADDWLIHSSEGPLWYRGAAKVVSGDPDQAASAAASQNVPGNDEATVGGDEEDDADVAATADVDPEMFLERLQAVGAQRMVGGHTPQKPRRIQTRLGGRVFLIDTGMLSNVYHGGRPSALVIENGTFTALYLDGQESLEVDVALPDAA